MPVDGQVGRVSKQSKVKKDRVWVCRGCCCGTKSKHPGIDHKELERAARRGAAAAGVRYDVTDCLGPCGQGNIVVVRRAGTIRWFRRVNDLALTKAVLSTAAGAELPAELDRHLMRGRSGKKPNP